jgi:hypothetical protein
LVAILRGSIDGVTSVNISSDRTFGILAAAVALAFVGFAAQAEVVTKTPRPPACTKIKEEAKCKARESCTWTAEVKDAKGKVRSRGACRARAKGDARPALPSVDSMDMMKKSKNLPDQKYDAQ